MQSRLIVVDNIRIFEKEASTTAEDACLAHEEGILTMASHPGVVGLIGLSTPSGSHSCLRTRAVLGRPLAIIDGLSGVEVARLGSLVGTTLADLHEIGIVHGAIDADHIVIGAEGRPILCGLSHATAQIPAARAGTAGDVRALARTLAPLARAGDDNHLAQVLQQVARSSFRRRTARQVGPRTPSARRLATLLDRAAHPLDSGHGLRAGRR